MAVYGLGYGLGQIGAGIPQAIMQGEQVGMQRRQQEMELANQERAQQEVLGLRQAAEGAFDPATGTMNQDKYLALVAQLAPSHYQKILGTAGSYGMHQASAQKSQAQAGLAQQKTESMKDRSSREMAARHLLELSMITDPDPKKQLQLRGEAYRKFAPEYKSLGLEIPTEDFINNLTDDVLEKVATDKGISFTEMARIRNKKLEMESKEKMFKEAEEGKNLRKVMEGIGPDGKTGFMQLTEDGKIPQGWRPLPPRVSTTGNPGDGANPKFVKAMESGVSSRDLLPTLPLLEQGEVEAILEGRRTAPVLRGGNREGKLTHGEKIMQYVYAIDPQWNEQRAQVRKEFAKDKNIRSLNTASVHFGEYYEAAMGLKSGVFPVGNKVVNKMRELAGSGKPITAKVMRQVVAGEQATALKGNATDIEIAHVLKVLDQNGSPEQVAAAVKAGLRAMKQKLNTSYEAFKSVNPDDQYYNPILPSTMEVYRKHGILDEDSPYPERQQTKKRQEKKTEVVEQRKPVTTNENKSQNVSAKAADLF